VADDIRNGTDAVSIVLQAAMADIDAEYQTVDTSTATGGEARPVTGVQAKFLAH
jgi:hypothetical protein